MDIFEKHQARDLNLELLAKQVVEGFIIGLHRSPFHGFSVEFAEHRLYNQGESTKTIDWKVYARTNKLFSKKYEEETNLRCQIVIDHSSSMNLRADTDAGAQLSKLEFSALAAAALMRLLQKQRDAFGLTIFGESIETHTKAKSSNQHFKLLTVFLQKMLADDRQRQTNAAAAIHNVADSIHKRSLVIIFSDMFDDVSKQTELFAALQHLKYSKHEVILFHVVNKDKELDFDYENRPYEFEDMETGERIKLQPNQIKEHYTQQVAAYTEALKLKCLQYKIDFVEADINKGFKEILQAYLIKRKKMGA
ncbi:MAG TPA: DUF58 domain-containing protein [Saprospiraceae bacterium]|nr:DUF58 domain-containing protein [Saprospiraceae bacterium]